jgi:hypothetical protein
MKYLYRSGAGGFFLTATSTSSRMALNRRMVFSSPRAYAARLYAANAACKQFGRKSADEKMSWGNDEMFRS